MGFRKHFDFLIVGSGFAGSITAMALTNSGFDVCMTERGKHPRFAVGESSTPIADMILRDLSDLYNLPFLKKLSRYGEWQKYYPDVVCGLKRGFSYYPHEKGKPFQSDRDHANELLVAASADNMNSDTNWLRSDVDHFLIGHAKQSGIVYLENTNILNAERFNGRWSVCVQKESEKLHFTAGWIIDASGSPDFPERFFGTKSVTDEFRTNSFAVYSHFEQAGQWHEYLNRNHFNTIAYPYNPDNSALHHIIEEGWIWMLRFNNDLLSAGIVVDGNTHGGLMGRQTEEVWNSVLASYPSVQSLFEKSIMADIPGKIIKSKRLQRKLNRMYGDGWVALNHTAGFVDPLHSTGIAHSLSGIEKLLNLFTTGKRKNEILKGLEKHEVLFFTELSFIDLLVSVCYAARNHFRLFAASSMLYFIASVRYEQSRLKGMTPEYFLCSDQSGLHEIVFKSGQDLEEYVKGGCREEDAETIINEIRKRIEPYNSIGLMDESKRNMYRHTVVVL